MKTILQASVVTLALLALVRATEVAGALRKVASAAAPNAQEATPAATQVELLVRTVWR